MKVPLSWFEKSQNTVVLELGSSKNTKPFALVGSKPFIIKHIQQDCDSDKGSGIADRSILHLTKTLTINT